MKKNTTRGRKPNSNWKKIKAFDWRNKTDTEIAAIVGCTVPNVNIKRGKLIKKHKAEGKSGDFYTCRRKWQRKATAEATA